MAHYDAGGAGAIHTICFGAESGHKKITPQTLNLAKCQQLLGHKSIANTALYLGIEQREALDLAKKIKV